MDDITVFRNKMDDITVFRNKRMLISQFKECLTSLRVKIP